MELTHINHQGRGRMVNVSNKDVSDRMARAAVRVTMAEETVNLIQEKRAAKGDVLAVSQVAAIMGAKRTPDIIPMCHPLALTGVDVSFRFDEEEAKVEIEATAKITGKTGVEMEALTAVSIGALTIYDMCKAVDKGMVIANIRLVSKSGGKSGSFMREGEESWQK
jgi:cyclic pyranopterin phosphate synthase